MNRLPRPRLAVLAGIVAEIFVAGCGDATGNATDVRPVPAGALSVSLSGALVGQYEAEGAQPIRATRAPATFASALAGPDGDGRYFVSAFRARGDRQDMLTLHLSAVSAAGDFPAAGNLVLGSAGNGALPEHVFRFTAVTVRVTAISESWIAGEFSGEAVGGSFANSPFVPNDTVRFSTGTFEVPIIRP